MITSMPQTGYGELGALLSALIVIFSLIGLTMHSDFYAGVCRRDYWVYYTNLSNLFVFLYFAVISPLLYANPHLHSLLPHAEYALMMSILLTHFVFHFMLFPRIRRSMKHAPHTRKYDIARADSIVQHYIVPWLTLFYWLLCSPGKANLTASDALYFTAFPVLYLVFVFIRAKLRGRIHESDSAYPYPFLDIERYGTKTVAMVCSKLFFLCIGAGFLGVALTDTAFFFLGDGHAFLFI